jgi:hypothetical protein
VRLRNACTAPVEYTIDDGPVNTRTSWVVVDPGATRELYVQEGQWVFSRFSGDRSGGHGFPVSGLPAGENRWRYVCGTGNPVVEND